MKIGLLIIIALVTLSSNVLGQKPTKIAGVMATLNGQSTKTFVLEDENVKITLDDAYIRHLKLNIFNKTTKSIGLNWKDCFYIINGNSEPVINLSTIDLGALSGVNQNGYINTQKIGSKSNVVAKFGSRNTIFDSRSVEEEYKKSGSNLINKLVLSISIDNVVKEYIIQIEQHSKKNK